ncbi:MAG: DUF1579 family protein [Planctomycetota bacterium]
MSEGANGGAGALPGPEHVRILRNVGTWRVDCTWHFMGQAIEGEGRETVRALGPWWTASDFEASLFGTPLQGAAQLGFDPQRGVAVGTWIDGMNPVTPSFVGSNDPDGVIRLSGRAYDPIGGRWREVETEESELEDGRRRFLLRADGELFMDYLYTREA